MKKGYFVPELLMPPLLEVEAAMRDIMPTQQFQDELQDLLHNYAGRPTPLTFCPRLSEELGFELWLKREDLLHSGAHKINNTLGQALLAKYMGKTSLVAETGAGQHGVATAVAAARLGMSCTIYMGAEDVERQAPNVMRMRLLGATVHPVESGSRTLKDAINEALRAWIVSQQTTHYCFGTAAGPHPFPTLVRMFQQVIGQEVREQMLARARRLPDAGTGEPGCFNSAPLNLGSPGVLHGNRTMLLQNRDGQIEPSHSVSAGLDYPGVGPEQAFLHKTGRVRYVMVRDARALAAFEKLCHAEGILPALESSHALTWVLDHPEEFEPGSKVVVNLSGRGDKDLAIVRKALNLPESGDIC